MTDQRKLLALVLLNLLVLGAWAFDQYETRVVAARYGWTAVEARCVRARDVINSPACLVLASRLDRH